MVDPYATNNELSGRIRERSLSPVAVVDACLARIAALNSHLNAFITVDAEGARAEVCVRIHKNGSARPAGARPSSADARSLARQVAVFLVAIASTSLFWRLPGPDVEYRST
jgi:Asp-tRNA(Asn)/Glu-tRNA(Gln) amidotransferase A subunit family amidase